MMAETTIERSDVSRERCVKGMAWNTRRERCAKFCSTRHAVEPSRTSHSQAMLGPAIFASFRMRKTSSLLVSRILHPVRRDLAPALHRFAQPGPRSKRTRDHTNDQDGGQKKPIGDEQCPARIDPETEHSLTHRKLTLPFVVGMTRGKGRLMPLSVPAPRREKIVQAPCRCVGLKSR